MKKPMPIHYRLLRLVLNSKQLNFKTTAGLKILTEVIGQERALEALIFGIGIKRQGYNLYGMGPTEMNKHSFINQVLKSYANKSPTPPDWCYIHNFSDPAKPIALKLPPGKGTLFQQDLKQLIDEALSNILTVFESDEYRSEMKKIHDFFNKKRKMRKKRIKINLKKAKKEQKHTIPSLYKERHYQEKMLRSKLFAGVINPIFSKTKKKYSKYTEIVNYLSAIEEDISEHIHDFIKSDEKTNLLTFSLENPALTKYKINLLVDNSKLKGAPIIFEETPVYTNLICRVEYTAELGALMTNFTLIKAGSLHRANGGYLIIEARKLKKNSEAWEALKSALYSHTIKVEPIQQTPDLVKPVSLEPSPIPLEVKVILLGDRNTYYSLSRHDRDFTALFKVPVDFDESISRSDNNIQLYARLIGTIVKHEKLRKFDASAVAAVIDFSTRLAEDREKLSTSMRDIENVVIESDYWAGLAKEKVVTSTHVKKTIVTQIRRMDRARELYYEDINRNFITIYTKGKSLGQVNCLSVRRVGNFSYGHPTRVTARVRIGQGRLIDIQREIKLAGPMHSKAGLIITNFLASRFSPDILFSLTASLSFEQLYCWTDGDSASVGELCALLSALARIPIFQFLAVTGSIDQYGEVQPVGGVNEKIEGFFDICMAKGLTGKQGVLIPHVNQKNLMLREDVVQAAKEKKFFIYPISTIDEALFLLTGVEAGSIDKNGHYLKHTMYYQVEKYLKKFTETRLRYKKIKFKK